MYLFFQRNIRKYSPEWSSTRPDTCITTTTLCTGTMHASRHLRDSRRNAPIDTRRRHGLVKKRKRRKIRISKMSVNVILVKHQEIDTEHRYFSSPTIISSDPLISSLIEVKKKKKNESYIILFKN